MSTNPTTPSSSGQSSTNQPKRTTDSSSRTTGSSPSRGSSATASTGSNGSTSAKASAGGSSGPRASSWNTGNISIPFAKTLGLDKALGADSFSLSGANAKNGDRAASAFGLNFSKDGQRVGGVSAGTAYKTDKDGNMAMKDTGKKDADGKAIMAPEDAKGFVTGGSGKPADKPGTPTSPTQAQVPPTTKPPEKGDGAKASVDGAEAGVDDKGNLKASVAGPKGKADATAGKTADGKDKATATAEKGKERADASATADGKDAKSDTSTRDGKTGTRNTAELKDGKGTSTSKVRDANGNGSTTTAESKDGTTDTSASISKPNGKELSTRTSADATGKDIKLGTESKGKVKSGDNEATANQKSTASAKDGKGSLTGGIDAKAGKNGASASTTGDADVRGTKATGEITSDTSAKFKDKDGKTWANKSSEKVNAETEGAGPGEKVRINDPTRSAAGIGPDGKPFAKGEAYTRNTDASSPYKKDPNVGFTGSSSSTVTGRDGKVEKEATVDGKATAGTDTKGTAAVRGRVAADITGDKSRVSSDLSSSVTGDNGSATADQTASGSGTGNGSVRLNAGTDAKQAGGKFTSGGSGWVRGKGTNLDGKMDTNTSATWTDGKTTNRNVSKASEVASTRGGGDQDININDPATSSADSRGASGKAWADIKASNSRNEDPLAKFTGSSVSTSTGADGKTRTAAIDGTATGQTDLAGTARARGEVSSSIGPDGAKTDGSLTAGTTGTRSTDATVRGGGFSRDGSVETKGLDATARNMFNQPLEAKTGGWSRTTGPSSPADKAYTASGTRISTPDKGTAVAFSGENASGPGAQVNDPSSVTFDPRTGKFTANASGSASGGGGSNVAGGVGFKPSGSTAPPELRTRTASAGPGGRSSFDTGFKQTDNGNITYNGDPVKFENGNYWLGNSIVRESDPMFGIIQSLYNSRQLT